MKNKILYFGHFLPMEEVDKFVGPAISANRMQFGLIEAINRVRKINTFAIYPIASFPTNKCIFLKKRKINAPFPYLILPMVNLFLVKQFFIQLWIFTKLLFCTNKSSTIITFNPYIELSSPVLFAKKIKKFKTHCIVADIPTTIPDSYSNFKKKIRKIEIKKYNRNLVKYDTLTVLNQEVISHFDYKGRFYVMNGGITREELQNAFKLPVELHYNNIILFTGALEEYNGIVTLIEAFNKLENQEIELHIAGDGTLKKYVQDKAARNSNIVYLGYLSNDEVRKLQSKAGLLINPRPVNTFSMKLSFPSKLFEYMLSGTPVMTTRHNELKAEFDDCLFFTEDNSDSMAEALTSFFAMPVEDRFKKAVAAFKYLEENVIYDKHAENLLKLLEENR